MSEDPSGEKVSTDNLSVNGSHTGDEHWKRVELLGLSPESQRKALQSKSSSEIEDEDDTSVNEEIEDEHEESNLEEHEKELPEDIAPGQKSDETVEDTDNVLQGQSMESLTSDKETEDNKDSEEDGYENKSNEDTDDWQDSDEDANDSKEEEEATPTHVPRRTGFWDHDDRFTDINVEESRQPRGNATLWDKSEVKRWEHDRYVESEQGPKEEWEKMPLRDRPSGRGRRRPRENRDTVADYIPDTYKNTYNNEENQRGGGGRNRRRGRGYNRNTQQQQRQRSNYNEEVSGDVDVNDNMQQGRYRGRGNNRKSPRGSHQQRGNYNDRYQRDEDVSSRDNRMRWDSQDSRQNDHNPKQNSYNKQTRRDDNRRSKSIEKSWDLDDVRNNESYQSDHRRSDSKEATSPKNERVDDHARSYRNQEEEESERNYYADRKEDGGPGDDGAPRDKPKRYSSQRQKPGTGPIDDEGSHYQQLEYLQQQFMTNAHFAAMQNQQVHNQDMLSKTANIKILQQKILQLQQELQQQIAMPQQQPMSNLVNPQTNIPMQLPGMMASMGDMNRGQVYGDPYSVNPAALQSMLGDGTGLPNANINPAVLSQLMSSMVVQDQLGNPMYAPPPPPPPQPQTLDSQMMKENDHHECRRSRPAAIPIKPPPGL